MNLPLTLRWPQSEPERLELLRLLSIEKAARAVIAAGRPHGWKREGVRDTCICAKCEAYDALKSMLEP